MQHKQKDIQKYAIEYYKCKKNVLYFIFNYVYLPEIGSSLKVSKENTNRKIVRLIRSVIRFHKVIFLASRQLGKSSVSAMLIAWAVVFYPGNKAVILNMKKGPALENLKKIKFIMENLPQWMIEMSGASDVNSSGRLTYIELKNGSRVETFYPSSVTSPDTLARSLTAPILYIDEAAFIRHIESAYGSAQPILTKAREQAKKNNYPYFTLMTSTPNGVYGDGEFYFNIYSNSVDGNEVFDDDENLILDHQQIVNDDNKNSFVSITYHWSEDPTKDEEWYKQQIKELNFNMRRVNQELDLVFLGGTNCIFDDEIINTLKSHKPIEKINFGLYTLKLYEEITLSDFYIIGVDTAKSLTGDYCAVEIYRYSTFQQVGELFDKLGSVTKYSQLIQQITEYFFKIVGNRILLGIEANSIGNQVIEHFENLEPDKNTYNIDFDSMIYSSKDDPTKLGIYTGTITKPQMISFFYEYVIEDPSRLKSSDLIRQLNIIEKKSNGTVSAKTGYNDDLFMASCFCSYIRAKTELEILPLIKDIKEDINSEENLNKLADKIFMGKNKSIDQNKKIDSFRNTIPTSDYMDYDYNNLGYQEDNDDDDDLTFVL